MKAAAEQQPLSKPSTQPIQPQTAIPLQEVTIENELLKMVWSNEGRRSNPLSSSNLKMQRQRIFWNYQRILIRNIIHLPSIPLLKKTNFQRQRYNILEHSTNKIVFTTKLEEGINIIKTIDLPSDKYNINMDIALENTTDTEVSFSYNIIASSLITHEGEPSTDMAAVAGVDVGNKRTKLLHTAPKEFPSRNESVGIVWAGSTNKYFATILKPASSDSVASMNAQAFDAMGALSNEKADTGDFMVSLQTNKFRIPPHQSVKHSYLYFMGPKKEDVLEHYDTLDTLLSYGWLTSISKVLLAF